MMNRVATLIASVVVLAAPARAGGIQSATLTGRNGALTVEAWSDRLLHLHLGATAGTPIPTTPMVSATAAAGPSTFSAAATSVETAALRLELDSATLCAKVSDKASQTLLQTVCPAAAGLSIHSPGTTNVYGLGQMFSSPGETDGDRLGKLWQGGPFGNAQLPFSGGSDGYTQIPVLYALDAGGGGYAIFVDNVSRLTWDLRADPWQVTPADADLSWFFFAGSSPTELRRTYLSLTGRPPVPPRRMFGLWVSQEVYESWGEVESDLKSLRDAGFPVDGFVLDLSWFGGTASMDLRPYGHGPDPSKSRMGSLTWDETSFPNPAQEIQKLKRAGVGLMLIEESYISKMLPEYAAWSGRGALVRSCAGCGPAYLSPAPPWWGQGGMLDWSRADTADAWHDAKRQPLIDMGITAHWTDLGEPEDYDPSGWYFGDPPRFDHTHAQNHNLYNFNWLESIWRGYQRHGTVARPFLLSRSGTAGIQRFGAAMWSGDIGGNMSALAAHLASQAQMSFAGIDYYGADAGGHDLDALDGDVDELYTRWFADACLFDVPVRPHPRNVSHTHPGAPSEIGDVAANLANVRQRYDLIPYLYSLAHVAYRQGDPVFPPLVFAFPADPAVRTLGSEKMIGPFLLGVATAKYGEGSRRVYLPKGRWVDYHTQAVVESAGAWLDAVSELDGQRVRLPLYAREGAILPLASPAAAPGALRLRIYPGAQASDFTVYEDDGATIAYQAGAVAVTHVTQQLNGDHVAIGIDATAGTYAGAPDHRITTIELVIPEREVAAVSLGGQPLTTWRSTSPHVTVVTLPDLPTDAPKQLDVTLR